MSKTKKQSGLVGITSLMRQEALNTKIDLQQTEERVLNNVEVKSKNTNDDKSEESDVNEIYKLAKDLNLDLDISINSIGKPDKVSACSRSSVSGSTVRQTAEIQKPQSVRSKATKTSRTKTRTKTRSRVSQQKKEYQETEDSEPIQPPQQFNYNNYSNGNNNNYDEKRNQIDNVLGGMRKESHNTFSTDMERTQDMKASKLEQIASIKMALAEEGIDTSMISIPSIHASSQDIDSTLNLLLMKNSRYRYSSLAEEVVSAGAEILESVFDGTRKVPIFGISPDQPLKVQKSVPPITFKLCNWENGCDLDTENISVISRC